MGLKKSSSTPKKVKIIYNYDKNYSTIHPTDAIGNICKTGDVELNLSSDFKPTLSKAIQPLNKDGQLVSFDDGDFFDKTGELITGNLPAIERIVHGKLILRPLFAIDMGILLIDLVLGSLTMDVDKKQIKEKFESFLKKLEDE